MPAAPGEAAPGTLNRAARGDHVHPLPTPGQLNALPADGTAKNASLLGGKPPEDYLSADGTAKNASLLGGKAPEYYLTPSNLLVNSNFTKVVNRRGITKTTAWQECIDRYIARMSNTLLSFDDDGMTIRSEENTSGFIYQKVADYERLLGKTVTYAAKLNGEILTKIYNIPATLPSSWTDFGSVNKNNHTISAFSSDGTNLSFSIGFENGASTKAEWAALYEGAYTADTLPPYVPKGYANELLACEVAAKGSIISRDLLWQNASPASEFAAQKISIDLSAYSRVGIDFRYNNDEDGFCYGEFGVGVNGFVNPKQVTLTADIMYIVGRGGYARTTGVEFQDCYRYPSYNTMGTNELKNQLLVPWRIYGIKGVLV